VKVSQGGPCSAGGMLISSGKRKERGRKTCPTASLIGSNPGLNQMLLDEKSTCNRLNRDPLLEFFNFVML
jgi:hypothetical protein